MREEIVRDPMQNSGAHSPRWCHHLPAILVLSFAVLSTFVSLGFILEGVAALSQRVLSDAGEKDRPRPVPYVPSAHEIGTRVLARNIFDARTGSLTWHDTLEQQPAARSSAAVAQAEPPQLCENSGLRLVASVVDAIHPEHSFAAVRVDQETHLVGLGSQLGQITLLALRPAFAYVQAAGADPCLLPVFLPASQRPKPAPPKPAEARAAPPQRKPAFSAEELAAAIRPLGGDRFAVSREFLARALRNPTGSARGARLRPSDRDGRTVGWELVRMRPDSLLARMGLQKGDLLRSVNGHDLSDASALLIALRSLQRADAVSLSFTRGGGARQFHYTLD